MLEFLPALQRADQLVELSNLLTLQIQDRPFKYKNSEIEKDLANAVCGYMTIKVQPNYLWRVFQILHWDKEMCSKKCFQNRVPMGTLVIQQITQRQPRALEWFYGLDFCTNSAVLKVLKVWQLSGTHLGQYLRFSYTQQHSNALQVQTERQRWIKDNNPEYCPIHKGQNQKQTDHCQQSCRTERRVSWSTISCDFFADE